MSARGVNICPKTSWLAGMTSAQAPGFIHFYFYTAFIWFVVVQAFPLCPSFVHYIHGFLLFAVLHLLYPLLCSPLFSSSPDVGADPGGSCCSLQFVSVKHQLVSEWVCARLHGHSCSCAVALDFYSFSWKRERERDSIDFHGKTCKTQRVVPI